MEFRVHYEMMRREGYIAALSALSKRDREIILRDPFKSPLFDAGTYSTMFNLYRNTIAYEDAGQQVIVLGPRMQEAFRLTSLDNIPVAFLRLPHPCFFLSTPGCGLSLWGGTDTGWHRIEGAYVLADPSCEGLLSVLLWGARNEKSIAETDDATYWFNLDISEAAHPGGVANLEHALQRRISDQDLRHGLLETLEIDAAMVRGLRVDLSRAAEVAEANNVTQRIRGNLRDFLRIVINAVLYLNSAGCELSPATDHRAEIDAAQRDLARKKHANGKDAKKLRRRLETIPRYRVTWIGPTLEKALETSRGEPQEGRKVASHLRRGHWHSYWTGPLSDATQRRKTLKWVMPTWVGVAPETAPEKPRVYAVRGG